MAGVFSCHARTSNLMICCKWLQPAPTGACASCVDLFPQPARLARGPPALRKMADPEHAHSSLQRNCDYISTAHGAARRVDPLAIDADMTRCRQAGRSRAGANNTRMPQPLVDALSIHSAYVGSFAPVFSFSFSSASLANGESGSACCIPFCSPRPLMYLARSAGSRSGLSLFCPRSRRSRVFGGRRRRAASGFPSG
jgi:hypothetical protein